MVFSDLVNRITGISCPVFGISWTPTEPERNIARRIIVFLEARRVLYAEFSFEPVCQCIDSVVEIKNYLTTELQDIDEKRELSGYVRAMRTACNKFLTQCQSQRQLKCMGCKQGSVENWFFIASLGELRGVFGVMIGQIAKAYGLDVEDDLAQIIPE